MPITVNFSANVITVDAGLTGTFSSGQTLNGSYTFDSSFSARAGSNSTFAVFDALISRNFSIGSYSGSSNSSSEIQVDNNPSAPNVDRYGLVSRTSQGPTRPSVGIFNLDACGFRLDDSTNSVISDALNLPTNISFSSFDSSVFFLFFVNSVGTLQLVTGTLTNVSNVPEPSSLAIFMLGLIICLIFSSRSLHPA